MKLTASPTVLRFLTSSSGMRTPNFSSALTTMVIMEMESMSRSSVKDLSSSTASGARPVSSLTISAKPARISSLLAIGGSFSCIAGRCCRKWSGPRLRPLAYLGKDNYLCAEDQPGAETDLKGQPAAQGGVLLQEPVRCQRDGGGGRVAGFGNVPCHCNRLGQLQLLHHLVDDAHVGLVGDEGNQVFSLDAGGVERLLGHLGHFPHCPAEHGLAVLPEGGVQLLGFFQECKVP